MTEILTKHSPSFRTISLPPARLFIRDHDRYP